MGLTTTADSATIGSSEYSLPADTTSGVPTSQTDDCWLQAMLDLSAVALGDTFEFKVYEKVSSTQRLLFGPIRFIGPCTGAMSQYVTPPLHLSDGWDATLKKIAGTDRSIAWSLRKTT